MPLPQLEPLNFLSTAASWVESIGHKITFLTNSELSTSKMGRKTLSSTELVLLFKNQDSFSGRADPVCRRQSTKPSKSLVGPLRCGAGWFLNVRVVQSRGSRRRYSRLCQRSFVLQNGAGAKREERIEFGSPLYQRSETGTDPTD